MDWNRYVKDKWVNQESRTLDPEFAVRKREITVPGGTIYGRRALAAGSFDHEESNLQDQLKYQVNSQSSK